MGREPKDSHPEQQRPSDSERPRAGCATEQLSQARAAVQHQQAADLHVQEARHQ